MSELPWIETEVQSLGINVPRWIEPDITVDTVAAVLQGGCDSGAYMPAVRYYDARVTMSEHGDAVLQFLEDELGEIPDIPKDASWSGIACHFLSMAVELWCGSVEQEILDELEDLEDEEDEDDNP